MIDIHTHVLPGFDDGARDMDESLSILRTMLAEGITRVVATPHVIPGGYDYDSRAIAEAVSVLQNAAKAEGIAIEILAGAENYLTPDLPERIAKDKGLAIAGGPFVLTELPMQGTPPYAARTIAQLVAAGLQPIIAHPERYADIQGDPSRIVPFLEVGAIFQINAGSLLGLHGHKAKHAAETIIRAGHPFVIASDIHREEEAKALSHAVRNAREMFAQEASGYLDAGQCMGAL